MSALNNEHKLNLKEFQIIVIQTFSNKQSIKKSFIQNAASKNEFFFNVCNSKFNEINMFFQKNKKFNSNKRKFQNDV